jgi:hypothetical protein
MRLLSLLARHLRSRNGAPSASPPTTAAGLYEEILEHGLDARRALALTDALERQGGLLDAIEALVQANRIQRDDAIERRLVRLRAAAFAHLDRSLPTPPWPRVVPGDGAGGSDGPPVVTPAELTPGLLLNGILQHGSVWVRGLVPRARVARLRRAIDRVFEAYDATDAGRATAEMARWYDPLDGIQNPAIARAWRRQGNGVLTADSPRAFFEFMETVHELGLDRLIATYLGERPSLSAEKCTLFRVDARDWRVRLANWHQDGAFLGDGIRTVNVWFALSRCGRDAPGMEVIPIRLERVLPVGEGSHYGWTVSPETVARELPGVPIWRPEFEEGDVLLFDHLTLHRTAADETMPNVRYAIESWFFASSVYPQGLSTPLVV